MPRVKVVRKEGPRAWYAVGAVYDVADYTYLATREGATNRCPCADCRRWRQNKKLFPLYQITAPPEDRGKLLFQDYCKILE